MKNNFDNPYYPYSKIQTGFNTMKGAEIIPYEILAYLLDMPDNNGYIPIDDNSRPRVRFAKYIWYDSDNPLSKALPTPEEKLSMLFNGDQPVINTSDLKKQHPNGYRIFPQRIYGQSQLEATTFVKCFLGRIIPVSPFEARIALIFDIGTNVNYETSTKTSAYSRSFDIEQSIVEALHGVNIAGIGVIDYSRIAHADCGSRIYYDDNTNVGRELTMSLTWMDSTLTG